MNVGYSNRLIYDQCYYKCKNKESTGPINYILNPISITNENHCLSVSGPRESIGPNIPCSDSNNGISCYRNIEIDSILSNRNVPASKWGGVNKINVTKLKVPKEKQCNKYLNPISSRLTNPIMNYREIAINRFYDLDRNPQINISSMLPTNTQLNARDNYVEKIPKLKNQSDIFPPYHSLC